MSIRVEQTVTTLSRSSPQACSAKVPPHFADLLSYLCQKCGAIAPRGSSDMSADLASSRLRLDPEWQLEVKVGPGFPRYEVLRRGAELDMLVSDAKPGAFLENTVRQNLRNAILQPYDVAVDDRCAVFSRLLPDFMRGDRTAIDRLIIPCAPNGGPVTSLLTIVHRGPSELDSSASSDPDFDALIEATERGRTYMCKPCTGGAGAHDLTIPCAKHN